MGYLEGFQNDVFFSYAHVDNKLNNWITEFYKTFQLKLDQRLGKSDMAKIWFDPNLSPNDRFDDVIEKAIENSAIFIAFTSRGFYNSDYCCKELNQFHNLALNSKYGLAFDGKSRIFNVQLFNIHHLEWTAPFRGAGSFNMFEKDEYNTKAMGTTFESYCPEYNKVMNEIVVAAVELIEQMKSDSTPALQNPTKTTSPKVFVSRTSDTLITLRNQIIKELKLNEIDVIDNICPPPYEKNKHEKIVLDELNASMLSVHLFDEIAGSKISEEYPITFSQEQAILSRKIKKDQLIFVPQALDFDKIHDYQHRDFLQDLIINKQQNSQYNLIRELSLPAIVDHIKSRLIDKKANTIGTDSIWLDYNETDVKHAVEYYNILAKEKSKIYMTVPGTNPFEDLSNYEIALKEVKTVIIVCVNVAQEWLAQRIKEIIIAIRTGKSEITKLSIYKDTQAFDLDLKTLSFI